jgi:hypothetical protein
MGAQNSTLLEIIRQNETRIANLETKILAKLETQNNTLLEIVTKSATEQVKATQSWAQALKTGLPTSPPTSQGTPVAQSCSIHPSSSASQQEAASSPHVIIDFATAERRSVILAEKPGAVRRQIDEALNDHDATKEIKCQGISRSARDNKYKLFFKDEKAAQTVRQHYDVWLKNYLSGARTVASNPSG